LDCRVITFYSQVPGLRAQASKRKKRAVPNTIDRTRPNPVERVLAQRARRAEVIIDQHQLQVEGHRQEHDHVPIQPAAVQPQQRLAQLTHQGQVPQAHPHSESQAVRFRNTTQNEGDSDDQAAEEGDGGNDLDRTESEEEAEEQARRRRAEEEELARQVTKKGKAKSHSTLTRRPSLTVVITNIPESSRKRVRPSISLFIYAHSSTSPLESARTQFSS
jgi:hypothetical protein